MYRTVRIIFSMAVLGTGLAMTPVSAQAQERLLRCATSPVSGSKGHHPRHFAQNRFYAPVNSAMFFSRAGSLCRWKTGRYHSG